MVVNTLFMFAGPLLCLLVLRTKEHILQHVKSILVTRQLQRKEGEIFHITNRKSIILVKLQVRYSSAIQYFMKYEAVGFYLLDYVVNVLSIAE
jgi:hypothetical protein